MKLMGLGITAASLSLGLAFSASKHPLQFQDAATYSAGCIVSVTVAPGYLPRAVLVVKNRRDRPIRIRLEGRAGSALPAVDFGTVGAGAETSFPYALPAGRNVLIAATSEGAARRQLFYVANRGAETCARRYVWPVE